MSCLPLKLIQMRRSVLNRMVQEGNWDIVGRGRDHHPLASDDQELLSAIAQLNHTADSTQHRERPVISVTSEGISKMSDGSSRKLLSVENNGVNESVTSRKRLGKHNSDDSKVKKDAKQTKKQSKQNIQGLQTTRHYTAPQSTAPLEVNATRLNKSHSDSSSLNDSSTNVMRVRKKEATADTTVNSPSTEARPRSWALACRGADSQNCSSNQTSDKHLSHKCCTSPSDDVQASSTQTPRLSILSDEIRNLNKQQGFAEPAMIPFISDSDDFVYVLVRRKAYLEWNTKQAGFRAAQHKNKCSTQQNIDRELSQLVTF